MPGPNGLEVAREIRRTSQVPILMLTVREEIATKVTAFDVGVDDYLTKPFQIEELLARIRAILRRTTPAMLDSPRVPYYSGSLFVDIENMHITSHGRRIQLTPREWGVLRVLIKYAGRMVSSRQLLQEAWGQDYGDEADYVRTYVTRLRKKLEPIPRILNTFNSSGGSDIEWWNPAEYQAPAIPTDLGHRSKWPAPTPIPIGRWCIGHGSVFPAKATLCHRGMGCLNRQHAWTPASAHVTTEDLPNVTIQTVALPSCPVDYPSYAPATRYGYFPGRGRKRS